MNCEACGQAIDDKRKYWFDKDHGGPMSRFLSSDGVRNIVTTVAMIGAFISIVVTNSAQRASIDTQEKSIKEQTNNAERQIEFNAENSANKLWAEYRDMSYQNLRFSRGIKDFKALSADEAERYGIFVERLFLAADLVTYKLGDDPQWMDSFAYEFSKHRAFILSDYFLKSDAVSMSAYCTYRRPVRKWVQYAFRNDNAAAEAIHQAELICQTELDKRGFSHG